MPTEHGAVDILRGLCYFGGGTFIKEDMDNETIFCDHFGIGSRMLGVRL